MGVLNYYNYAFRDRTGMVVDKLGFRASSREEADYSAESMLQNNTLYFSYSLDSPSGNSADRHNEGKIRWSLIHYPSLEDMVKVLAFGEKKYSRDNWQKGLKWSEVIDSMMRHQTAFLSGEINDPESGLPHTGHILCNAMFLSFMVKNRPDFNDLSSDIKTE